MRDNLTFGKIDDAFVKIGYRRSLIKRGYQYADLFSSGVPIRTVGRAIFGQEPLDYRSACFGIQADETNRPSSSVINELRALGAPQIFILSNGVTERWAITEREPVLQAKYKTVNLPNIISQNANEWNPKAIIRAKAGFVKPSHQQMDFVDIGLLPALENQAAEKIDYLLRAILHHTEEEIKKHNLAFQPAAVFRVVFRLLAAKLLKDRDVLNSSSIDFSAPQTALQAVTNYYGSSLPFVTSGLPSAILKAIAQEIGNSFSLRNISVDTLTYIYENTFVSPESRQKLGIHSTPSYVADYVMSQIPIEDLPRSQWNTTDPMAGHGIFLIAAMRRMRDFLPQDWSGQQRHKFFVSHLHGIEIDAFSVEVARMCLMLADFPEPNGWDLVNADVFASKTLENAVANTMILVGNPPFENIEGRSPDTPKPAELLRRALPVLPAQSLIGLVLPRSFVDGTDYKKERETILKDFEIISLTALPDRIFLHSDMETAIIVGRKHERSRNHKVAYREVKDRDRRSFRFRHQVTWEDKVQQDYFKDKMHGRLIVPLLREIWERLESYAKLGDMTNINIGVQYKPNLEKEDFNRIIRSQPLSGAKPGIYNVSNGFNQFAAEDVVYMATEKKYRRFENSNAWDLPWEKPKVIVPASRISRCPWRYAAAIDKIGLIISRRFYGIWPKVDLLDVEILAAFLNSPLAQVFTYAHSFQKDIPKRVYAAIPIPEISSDARQAISSLVHNYLDSLHKDEFKAKDILLQIDAEVLSLYNLSPRLEKQLLDIFWGYQRRVPFDFIEYIPREIDSWIPLHLYISEQFRDATPKKILERLPVIHDRAFLDYIKRIGMDEE
ncbi:MAG: SAM-dependent methyltransferase [Nitrospirae bacterium]|nr:SAM-dependent methyltransferase [Nitrospirota bacterium]MCL5236687.1 SAM-dependent methyltransferase [Nitrospirota bacterium]